MSRCFDRDTILQLNRWHRAYCAFLSLASTLDPMDLEYAYSLYLQSSYGDYLMQENFICVHSKCVTLRLPPPQLYFKDWILLEGMDSDIAGEKFSEFMGLMDMEYSRRFNTSPIIKDHLVQ